MRIRMRVDISGTRNGVDWPRRGEVVEVDDAEGAHMCANGQAEPVVEDRVETATAPVAEQRGPLTTKRGPGRPRKDAS
jgi:hypothetical protein